MKIFNKILIANRGEIALRIMRSARKMGISTVAVYSPYDSNALFVEKADEAYLLKGETIQETYLNIDAILTIAQKAGAEAIHPGYGFLSENTTFANACEKAGIVFIGPDSRAIRLMGNKVEARQFGLKHGIPMTKAITGDTETLIREAGSIPYPLLVKAAAGGGGKGMRIVREEDDLVEILETTSREAASYFGHGEVFIEQYIEEPRHIEIQVIADHYGNVVHLYERECSIQRRYQKIIEESPSVTLDQEVREKMGKTAVDICKAIDYRNAGTIEFLVDKNLNYYFLEMNTRIQVEHPVTEMVTGIDIVREQILIAAGNKLGFSQEDIHQKGHAIECRIYAEDYAKNFLPSPGKMSLYQQPHGEHVRVDSGMDSAVEIHSFYDPMISKLIVWGEDREIARERMTMALRNYVVQGIKTNIPFLLQLISLPSYIHNEISTRFCDDYLDSIVSDIEKERARFEKTIALKAYLAYSVHRRNSIAWKEENAFTRIGYWRNYMAFRVFTQDTEIEIRILRTDHRCTSLLIDGEPFEIHHQMVNENQVRLECEDSRHILFVSEDEEGSGNITYHGFNFGFNRSDILVENTVYRDEGSTSGDMGRIVSPMPGKVIKISVSGGQTVDKGETLLIVEAMKMENAIKAPAEGTVRDIKVAVGDMVDGTMELVAFDPKEEITE